ncbi:helix-turn-helix domain-containing protein [Demequina sediminicola]|uniref:helix-turn-helix domain-containing protein n=1 Tax=Demequina sediminicola TaxID=1095026 RepID=UPI00191C4FA8|nr:XRE family transcriptional regulator [Demequina sediminicola]
MSVPIPSTDSVIDAVPFRLRRLRQGRGMTLQQLSELTDVSLSTLSRIEGGERRPSLEILVRLAQVYRVPLDDLVGMPQVGDPRVRLRPRRRHGRIEVPLHHRDSGVNVLKIVIPPTDVPPQLRRHPGSSWIYVLSGTLRVVVGEESWVVACGEAVEFDTSAPHWFGADGGRTAEILSIYGPGHRCFGDQGLDGDASE